MARRYDGIYALGVGLLAFGIAEVGYGNGFIAAFTCGLALAIADHDIAEDFEDFSENLSSILSVFTFFIFGALIVATGYGDSIVLLLAFALFAVLVARPLAVTVSFLRVKLPAPHRAFIAWFGPKGVASILFALFVLKSAVDERNLIFEIAAYVILASILVHGLTDTVGSSWIEKKVKEEEKD
jgi:NhaP-type Na+/H+ and K+/H+ antiporter